MSKAYCLFLLIYKRSMNICTHIRYRAHVDSKSLTSYGPWARPNQFYSISWCCIFLKHFHLCLLSVNFKAFWGVLIQVINVLICSILFKTLSAPRSLSTFKNELVSAKPRGWQPIDQRPQITYPKQTKLVARPGWVSAMPPNVWLMLKVLKKRFSYTCIIIFPIIEWNDWKQNTH